MVNKAVWEGLCSELNASGATLVAVSKKKPESDIQALYDLGQRDFGENYVQELEMKQGVLPKDIRWHFIGHLQSNKVKNIVPFVHLIHGVDSFKLLCEIDKQSAKCNRVTDVLLQLYIADEDTKFGMDEKEILELMDYYNAQNDTLVNVRICGLMGMASNTDNEAVVSAEFGKLKNFFNHLAETSFLSKDYFTVCSMGMSADYKLAVAEGGNMVRIGSMLFGSR